MSGLRLLKRVWQRLPLSDYARWRVTSWLLEPLLPLIEGSVVRTAFLREKEWRSRSIRPFHGDPFPTLPSQECADLFFWGVIDWRYRIQRPQHLARGFAEDGYRVFYISTTFVNDRQAGFELEQLDAKGRLYSIRLHLKGRPPVYAAPPAGKDKRRLRASLVKLLNWTMSGEIISIVQHPYWYELARAMPDSRFIYDCMDYHEGFGNNGEGIAAMEYALLKESEAVITTSQWLQDIAVQHNPNSVLIRNAADYDFFSRCPASVFKDTQGKKVLGYYGAIASWMDTGLLRKVAESFPECLLLLVGADEGGARQQLSELKNVLFTGEVSYAELPFYLYGMDICLLPFRVIPLTLATNPVKIYEYLSAGKPVVAIDLPEMTQFGGLIKTASSNDGFIERIRSLLSSPSTDQETAARRRFAAQHTWSHRVRDLSNTIANLPAPRASIIVLTYNNLELTKACLDSVVRFTAMDQCEIVVVDNASSDGSPLFLQEWAQGSDNCRLILNDTNRGFAAGNNQGLAAARGEYLVLLNNDTEVTHGWLATLISHFKRNPKLGLVGPVTDNIGNEARISLHYRTPDEMHREAREHTLAHMGELRPMRTVAFFCVMLRRKAYESIGTLDESFGLGFFEDDDYCRRAERLGWEVGCAEDVFVHHRLSASFGKLGKARQALLDQNRKIYEAKWGPWTPHKYR